MNILLNLPDDILEKYQKVAKLEKRSRKNLMEKVLIDYIELPKLITKPKEPEKQFQEVHPPTPKSLDISAYQQELNSLTGTSAVAIQRRKWLQNKIYELNKQLK